MAKELDAALKNFKAMSFPGYIYEDEDLSDWKLEMSQLVSFILTWSSDPKNSKEFIDKLPTHMKELSDWLNSIQPNDPRDQELKIYCKEFVSVLNKVVQELLNLVTDDGSSSRGDPDLL